MEIKNEIVLGSDPGYGWNKHVFSQLGNGVWDKRIFPSLYTEMPTEYPSINPITKPDPFANDFDRYFKFTVKKDDDPNSEEVKFAVGRGVSLTTQQRVNENLSMNRPINMLTNWILSVIAMLATTRSISDYAVAITVPINQVEGLKAELKKYNIKGSYEVSISNEPNFHRIVKHINLRSVYLLEQAIAAVYNEIIDIDEKTGEIKYKDKSLTEKQVAVIDIGTNTINYALIDHMNITAKEIISESGAAKFIKEIQYELLKKQIETSYADIQEGLISDNKFIVSRYDPNTQTIEEIDMTERIQAMKQKAYNSIVKPAIDTFITPYLSTKGKIDKIIITGGGVKLFSQFLKPLLSFSQVRIPEDPQLANALGAWKIAYMKENEKI